MKYGVRMRWTQRSVTRLLVAVLLLHAAGNMPALGGSSEQQGREDADALQGMNLAVGKDNRALQSNRTCMNLAVGKDSRARVPIRPMTHVYDESLERKKHKVEGLASVVAPGESSSFTIQLMTDDGTHPMSLNDAILFNWKWYRFIYVWITGPSQTFTGTVVNTHGNGTLTATFTSDFPGQYSVYIEEVVLHSKGVANKGTLRQLRPLEGSPFALEVVGQHRTLVPESLPLCTALHKEMSATESRSWPSSLLRPGTWISSEEAARGTLESGWVFQPKDCTHEVFTYDELMVIAALPEPTWIVVMGTSIHRGIFMSLVDMLLAQGQKDALNNSSVSKCWGWADVRVGNLRVSYQDFRMHMVGGQGIVCHDNRLANEDGHKFIQAGKEFLNDFLFRPDNKASWPDVIVFEDRKAVPAGFHDGTVPGTTEKTNVILEALPPDWEGKALMLFDFASLSYTDHRNPTVDTWEDGGPVTLLARTEAQQWAGGDARVHHFSTFSMYQPLFHQNENPTGFAGSLHFHRPVGNRNNPDSWAESGEGKHMIVSDVTGMIAQMAIATAVSSKEEVQQRADKVPNLSQRIEEAKASFEVCTDCPPSLVPFHIKGSPQPLCQVLTSLPHVANVDEAVEFIPCPAACLATDPTGKEETGSGPVEVRRCKHLYDGFVPPK